MKLSLHIFAAPPFLWLASTVFGSPTDNPVTTFYGENSYEWTESIKWSETFPVTDYGAVADDGIDDRSAIMAAIDAVHAAGGGVVYFPAGVWNVSDDLIIRDGVVLRGETPAIPESAPSHERGDGSPLGHARQVKRSWVLKE